MRTRSKGKGCALSCLIVGLLVLLVLPGGLLAIVKITGRDVRVMGPFAGLYSSQSEPLTSGPRIFGTSGITQTITIGAGTCGFHYDVVKGSSPEIKIGDTWIVVMDCEPRFR